MKHNRFVGFPPATDYFGHRGNCSNRMAKTGVGRDRTAQTRLSDGETYSIFTEHWNGVDVCVAAFDDDVN
jgi:hypothetical protein